MIQGIGTALASLLGLAFGSFLNVCLSRWPEDESILTPRSHCRACKRRLAWWENLPVASWLALRGRCRTCGAWIGWRYPAVELAVGVLWALVGWRLTSELVNPALPTETFYFDLVTALATFLFLWLLVALAALDAEHLWLPNWLTLPGAAAGFLIFAAQIVLFAKVDAWSSAISILLGRLMGIVAAAGLILVIRWTYKLVRKHEGMGLGDAKLMAMLAAWLGLPGALLSFVLGVVLSAVFALVLLVLPRARRGSASWAMTKLPLGSFLCAGGAVSALWGHQIILAYLRWQGFA